MWTKKQYINWKKTRPSDPTKWVLEDCMNADRLIDKEALKNLEAFLQNGPISDFVRTCAKAHMGSVECNKMLTRLHCYPDWM